MKTMISRLGNDDAVWIFNSKTNGDELRRAEPGVVGFRWPASRVVGHLGVGRFLPKLLTSSLKSNVERARLALSHAIHAAQYI